LEIPKMSEATLILLVVGNEQEKNNRKKFEKMLDFASNFWDNRVSTNPLV